MRSLIIVLLAVGASAVLAGRTPATGRTLLQAGSLNITCTVANGCTGCPDGCDTLPNTGNCIAWATQGYFRCKQCKFISGFTLPNVQRTPQADGSCGCRPGTYMDAAAKTYCTACPIGSYCPGGSEAFQATSAAKVACPTNMVTVNRRASSVLQCVNKPGYRYVAPKNGSVELPSAEICTGNTFSVGLRSQTNCTACPGGLRLQGGLDNNVNLFPSGQGALIPTTSLAGGNIDPPYLRVFVDGGDGAPAEGATNASSCLVPPGFFAVSRSKVVRCPKGEYRSNYVAQGTETSRCVPCPRGTTTFGSGSPTVQHCEVLVPGFYWLSGTTRSAGGSDTKPVTSICDQKFYCPGGYASEANTPTGRIECPDKKWTKLTGSKALSDCMVPPGHFLDSSNGVTMCAAGYYSPDWTASGSKCQKCGSGISSEPAEVLSTYNVTNNFNTTEYTTRVARTSASCYIEAGEGMTFTNGVWRKVVCNGNNHGVPARQWELRMTPCRECPDGTVTMSRSGGVDSGNLCTNQGNLYKAAGGGYMDPRACCTSPGYGFDGTSAAICAKGTYNDGKVDPADRCKPCPTGRTTQGANAADHNELVDCKLNVAGYGWQETTSFDAATNAALSLCAVGTYASGGAVPSNDNCKACNPTRSTRDVGATSQDECDVCLPGQGAADAAANCATCTPGTYGDVNRPAGSIACVACPSTPSAFTFAYGGSNNVVNVTATTADGATSVHECVSKYAPIVDDRNWYIPVDPQAAGAVMTAQNGQNTFEKCMAACDGNTDCVFFTFSYLTSACLIRVRDSASTTQRLAFKTLAASNLDGDETTVRKAGPKTMGSGVWSWWKEASAEYGEALTFNTTPANTEECLNTCNDDNLCMAVVLKYNIDGSFKECTFLQGKVTTPTSDQPETALRSMIRYRPSVDDKP